MNTRPPYATPLSRRRFLRLATLAGLSGAATALVPGATTASAGTKVRQWSDPGTWGGKVPGPKSVAVVSGTVRLDVNARVAGVVIKQGANLIFHPRRRVRLVSTGNVVVKGKLTMQPAKPSVVHRLIFRGVDESRFVGGGVRVLASDVGLWVMGRGVLDIAGTRRLAWTRTTAAVAAGATTLVLREDPVGWRVGDLLAVTPTLSPAVGNHALAYDYSTVAGISGRTVTLKRPTRFAHPAVEVAPGKTFTPEVLNLTRNVLIQGTRGGRAHILIHSSRRQKVRYALIRHMGPRQYDPESGDTKLVLGRYGLHFHMCGNGSRRSMVSGVVVRDCGTHAFVPHESHGVTFRRCISHDTIDDAYWYDQRPPDEPEIPAPPTDDVLYDRCVASLVKAVPDFRGFRMGGFVLGARNGNTARGCVAVGVQGNKTAAGFVWPETSVGSWTFQDCVAHNNNVHGIFVWQNNGLPHPVTRFVGYHNGGAGISHGAYRNGYHYADTTLYANRWSSIELHSLSRDELRLTFDNLRCDQGGLSENCVVTEPHNLPSGVPVLFSSCHFQGHTKAAFGFMTDQGEPESFEIVDCTFGGNEFWLASSIRPESAINVRDPVRGDITLRRFDQPGTFRPEWNASVS